MKRASGCKLTYYWVYGIWSKNIYSGDDTWRTMKLTRERDGFCRSRWWRWGDWWMDPCAKCRRLRRLFWGQDWRDKNPIKQPCVDCYLREVVNDTTTTHTSWSSWDWDDLQNACIRLRCVPLQAVIKTLHCIVVQDPRNCPKSLDVGKGCRMESGVQRVCTPYAPVTMDTIKYCLLWSHSWNLWLFTYQVFCTNRFAAVASVSVCGCFNVTGVNFKQ